MKKPKAPVGLTEQLDGDIQRPADMFTAKVMGNGTANSVVTMAYLSNVNGGTTFDALAEVGRDQAKAIAAGDLTQLEHMLLTQSIAMQAMFVDLAVRAQQRPDLAWRQTHTTLALKCASQSRQAITALAELRMPKAVMFAKQANVTTGPQQVNNGVTMPAPHAHAEKFQNPPNELLEIRHDKRLDARTTSRTSSADSTLAPLGKGDRATPRRR